MGLSEHEQKVLAEMERAFYEEDPRFAAKIHNANLERPRGPRAPLFTLLSIAGFVAIGFGLAQQLPWLGVLGFVGALVGLYGVVESATKRPAAPSGQSDQPSRRRKFGERLGERFERRREGDN